MPRLPIPGSDQGSWGQILNNYLSESHNADGTLKASVVTGTSIQDDTITEAKLDSATRVKLNSGGTSGVTSVNARTGAVVLTSNDVGLDNVDNTSDMGKPVSTAVQSALDDKADLAHTHTVANVTGLQTALDGKADTSHAHVIADVTGLQSALDGKIDVGGFDIDDLGDVTASGATNGQSLVFNAGIWGPADVGTGSTVVDATASVKGVVQLAGDLGGTAAVPTVPALAGKAETATTITGVTSLTGGGSLAANRTISLVNDAATPGNSFYYGTNAGGTKGFYALPAGTDPTLGGDLTGTASNAQIAASAVGSTELATNAVTTVKITDANVTTAKIADANVTTVKIADSNVTTAKIADSNVTTAKIADANVTTAKIADSNVTTTKIANGNVTLAKISTTGASTNQVLAYNGSAVAWTTPSSGSSSYTFRNVTANATAVDGDYIFVDSTSGAVTITLPTPAASAYVRVKRLNTAGNGVQVVAPAGGSYIDGVSVGSHTLNNQFEAQDFLSNGTNWYRV